MRPSLATRMIANPFSKLSCLPLSLSMIDKQISVLCMQIFFCYGRRSL